MSTVAEAFRQWPDFPKGLQVLVVDSDAKLVRDMTHKLESHHFYVTSFSTGEEACGAFANRSQTFHVALLEAAENDALDSCKILSFLNNVPIVMMSGVENMSLMVKTIALGAVEFLVKPLSEDKLKNIWQHVIRKAVDSSRDALQPGYLEAGRPIISAPAVVDEDHQSCSKHGNEISSAKCLKSEPCSSVEMNSFMRISIASERLAAPSTPQLERGGRTILRESTLDETPYSQDFVEFCDCEKVPSISQTPAVAYSARSVNVKDVIKDLQGSLPDSKASGKERRTVNRQAHILCCTIPMLESGLHLDISDALQMHGNAVVESESCSKDEGPSEDASHSVVKRQTETFRIPHCIDAYEPQEAISSSVSGPVISKDSVQYCNADSTCESEILKQHQCHGDPEEESKRKLLHCDKGLKDIKLSKRKTKVDWTSDLHRRFVQAVEYLGDEQAIPSRILEVMKVESLTRHNVASHLQKYRSHKKYVEAREVVANGWNQSTGNHGQQCNYAVGYPMSQLWMQPCPQMIVPPPHVWGHPKTDNPSTMQPIPQVVTGVPTVSPNSISWKPSMTDGWIPGLTSMAPCFGTYMNFFQTVGYPCREALGYGVWKNRAENVEISISDEKIRSDIIHCQAVYPPKELLDAAISEALSNPWKPLPLGLKPPLMESVMAELQRQGITTLSSSG